MHGRRRKASPYKSLLQRTFEGREKNQLEPTIRKVIAPAQRNTSTSTEAETDASNKTQRVVATNDGSENAMSLASPNLTY